jgi:hypothetical protein
VYLQNAYLRELRFAKENRLYHCVYLITHAIVQIITENMFDLRGRDGTEFYLKNFVDGQPADRQFSLITDEIHEARNVMAHRVYSSLQQQVEYPQDDMAEGWRREAGVVYINPRTYAEAFQEALTRHAHIRAYRQQSDEIRLIRKYTFIKKWLRLDKRELIAQEIQKLNDCSNRQDMREQEGVVRQLIYEKYNLT